jgi:hypothetical protein
MWVDLSQGVGESQLAAKFLFFIFYFPLQKHEKSKKNLKIYYFGGLLSKAAETRRLFLDFVLSKTS